MINRLADAGTAVLVTTHYLEEAEQCNRLGFMVAGELLVEGTPSEIKAQQNGHLLEFRVDQPQRAADLLKSKRNAGALRCSAIGCTSSPTATSKRAFARTRKGWKREESACSSAREGRFSLEDVFISVVEQAREHGKIGAEE